MGRQRVVPLPAVQRHLPALGGQQVLAFLVVVRIVAPDLVVAVLNGDGVVAAAAFDPVVALVDGRVGRAVNVIARAQEDAVVARVGDDRILARAGIDPVVAPTPVNRVLAAEAADDLGPVGARDLLVGVVPVGDRQVGDVLAFVEFLVVVAGEKAAQRGDPQHPQQQKIHLAHPVTPFVLSLNAPESG